MHIIAEDYWKRGGLAGKPEAFRYVLRHSREPLRTSIKHKTASTV